MIYFVADYCGGVSGDGAGWLAGQLEGNNTVNWSVVTRSHVSAVQVLTVYMSGVAAGSLGTSLTDSSTYLAGASGGVYALIAAHLATMTLNWREDNNLRIKKVVRKPLTKIIRLVFILLLTAHDVCFAVYVRFYDPDNRTGFMGHLCGALAGLTVGLFVLDNRFGFFR